MRFVCVSSFRQTDLKNERCGFVPLNVSAVVTVLRKGGVHKELDTVVVQFELGNDPTCIDYEIAVIGHVEALLSHPFPEHIWARKDPYASLVLQPIAGLCLHDASIAVWPAFDDHRRGYPHLTDLWRSLD